MFDSTMFDAFISGLLLVLNPTTLPMLFVGVFVGFWVGILPGLGGPVTMALMLPFIFDMKPVEAFAFLLGMFAVTSTTGDITSILFGVPGEPDSAAVILDGHPMAKNGETGRALSAALMSSLVGAIVGAVILALIIPIVRPVVLALGSPEYFALAFLGIAFVASLSGGNILKGVLAAGVGLLIGMIGLDPQSGSPRYTFGKLELWNGVGLVPIAVGLFAIPEILELWVKGSSIAERRVGKLGGVWQGVVDTFVHWKLTLRGSAIGTLLGIIPGLGAAASQWVAYAHAVQSAEDKSRFGKGDVRGVLAPGACNNSRLGGALVPTIAFGLPASTSMAILLGAFQIKGLVPGPDMLTTKLDITFSLVWLIVLSNIITVAMCYLLLNQLVKITYVRGALLIPTLLLLVFFGAYADSNSLFDLGVALIFGIIGLVMVYLGWQRPPLILGLVLGPLIEKNLSISYGRYEFAFLSRPLVIVIIVATLLVTFYPLIQSAIDRRRGIKRHERVATEV
ncbi:MAG: tripartite tricarboxylate transporter permease [Chloroflexota bacterium]